MIQRLRRVGEEELGGRCEWELFLTRVRAQQAEVREGRLELARRGEQLLLAVRAVGKGGRLGFACCTWSPRAARQAARRALELAELAPPDPHRALPAPEGAPPEVVGFDPEVLREGLDACGERALLLERAARAVDARVRRVRSALYAEGVREVWIVSSRGMERYARASSFEASVLVMAEQGGSAQTGWDGAQARFRRELDLEGLGRGAAEQALCLLGARPCSSRRMLALLDPQVTAQLLSVLCPSFLADQVAKGRSPLRDRVGQPLFSPLLRLVDDGRVGPAAFPFDDEGVARQRTVLVEGGRVRGFLYDSYWGQRLGHPSTGNAHRPGAQGLPTVSISQLILEPGSHSPRRLLEEAGEAFWVRQILGAHTADPVSGSFSVGAAGVLCRGGRPGEPVQGVAISGNLLELLGKVRAVGDDLRFFGRVGCPSLLVGPVDLGGR